MVRFPDIKPIRRGGDAGARVLECDLCVVGSGAAGLSAALEARRLGETVVLADAAPQLGGQAISAALGTLCGLYTNGPAPVRVVHGVMDGLLTELTAAGEAAPRRARNTVILDYSINAWQRWAERQVAAAGVTPLLGAVLRGVARDGGRVTALAFATRFGDVEVRARGVVDASGDAVVPWLSDLEMGTADEPILGTVMALFEGVDTGLCADWPRATYHDAMKRRGAEFGLVRFDGFIFPVGEGRVNLNLTHVETPLDAVGLALAGIEGKRQVDALLALFRDEFPEAYGRARVAHYGQAGIRQTRTIVGASRLTVRAVREGAAPADRVLRCTWPIELHTTVETTHWEVFGNEHLHYLPFGAMTPKGLDNVVVAGRCIDAEPAALASVRVMGPCFAMGRAAAEALHQVRGGSVHQLDIAALQGRLAANLVEKTRDPWLDRLASESGPEAHSAG
ncbi:FAD dependent oxidoreductase [Tistlia consotensis]|uniref:FAD dependent oxidoreductase n=1 Tax=Tistlia consotensis USBA 355 TaxID=560819 RepID=A0A1Y6CD52_9PROT|nr:FAD-dependent oxidoreductase [Tistlia consotensis]SMF48250.1 FAD dependent oxidoreductase [Tistlia consotensis USBA 355]SNR81520.1 FAD dependent oxidoreductase [Tistlia consotensis]